jgi:acyl-CoA synthetase (AMP-forming)/AMP-acid ligase II
MATMDSGPRNQILGRNHFPAHDGAMVSLPADMTIPRLVMANAERDPEGLAVVDGERRYTFEEFERAVIEAVQAWIAFGLGQGDRVGIWSPNSVDWMIAAMGVLGAGGVLLPINSRLRASEVVKVLHRTSASAICTVETFLGEHYPGLLRGADPDLAVPIVDLSNAGEEGAVRWESMLEDGAQEVLRSQAIARIEAISPTDVCEILFTSGTTGIPKGVVTTHGKNVFGWTEFASLAEIGPTSRLLLQLPLGLATGLKATFFMATFVGAAVVVQSVWNVEEAMHLIEEHGITYFGGPPTAFQDLLDSPKRTHYDLSSLRRGHVSGTTIAPALISRMYSENIFDVVSIGYGLSEVGPIATTRPGDDIEAVSQTAGKPMSGMEVRIVDDAGHDLGVEQPGEIVARGGWIMNGYYNDPEQTELVLTEEGWLHTGDIGLFDQRGYLRIVGRKKEMYITGGFNVYPAEVERCLMEQGSLSQVAVVPKSDDRLGEIGVAFVVRKPGEDADVTTLMAWVSERLAKYKVPRHISFEDSLPMNAGAKVLKDELRERAAKMTDAGKSLI